MNAQQHFALMCAAMTGPDEWLEAIQDEIDAMPEVLDFVTPEFVGRLDAEEDLDCDPTRHGYRTILEAEAYVIGWKAANELEDLVEDMADRDYHSRGQW